MEASIKLISANRFVSAIRSNNQQFYRFTSFRSPSLKSGLAARRINYPSLCRVPPFSFGWISFLMSRCTGALNGQINFWGRGAGGMRGRGILEEPPPLYFRRSLPSSVPPRPGRGAERRWGVVQSVGHRTVNADGEGSNPSAPANSSQFKTCHVRRQSLAIGSPASSQPFHPPSIDSTPV